MVKLVLAGFKDLWSSHLQFGINIVAAVLHNGGGGHGEVV